MHVPTRTAQTTRVPCTWVQAHVRPQPCGGARAQRGWGQGQGEGTLAAYKILRKNVTHMERDRELAPDIEKVAKLMSDDDILHSVERVCGELL